jgi:hypothetical protein
MLSQAGSDGADSCPLQELLLTWRRGGFCFWKHGQWGTVAGPRESGWQSVDCEIRMVCWRGKGMPRAAEMVLHSESLHNSSRRIWRIADAASLRTTAAVAPGISVSSSPAQYEPLRLRLVATACCLRPEDVRCLGVEWCYSVAAHMCRVEENVEGTQKRTGRTHLPVTWEFRTTRSDMAMLAPGRPCPVAKPCVCSGSCGAEFRSAMGEEHGLSTAHGSDGERRSTWWCVVLAERFPNQQPLEGSGPVYGWRTETGACTWQVLG